MKFYSATRNVYEAALDRIRYLFDEFPEVVASFSGGKDSTVCLHLCLQVAREKGRLPLRVLWIDQEVEWQGTVDLATEVMTHPDVHPMWFQMPMVITNNASSFERFNYCWREEDKEKWAHPQHPLSIKVNRYGTARFHELFEAITAVEFAHSRVAYVSGVRTQEAPKRFVGLTSAATYKWITWGKRLNAKLGHYTFYPIYDWDWRDIWKAIHDHGWPYNRVYDGMYRHGVTVNDMRISNLHHETAIQNLLLVQEIEPKTWVRVQNRIAGANTIKHLKRHAFSCPHELPFMFTTWPEYAGHIIDSIVQDQKNRDQLRVKLAKGLELFLHDEIRREFCKVVINTVLSSDWDFTKIANFYIAPQVNGYRKWRAGKCDWKMVEDPKFLPPEAVADLRRRLQGTSYE